MTDSTDVGSATGTKARGDSAPIDERFRIGSHLFSTRTSDGYQAVDSQSGQPVLFWTLRHPLRPGSDAARRFMQRLAIIKDIRVAIPLVHHFGVDPAGTAFVATEYIEGRTVLSSDLPEKDRIRLFIEACRIVSEVHRRGVVLGDISEHSFLIDSQVRLGLVSLLGSFEVEASQTTMLPPPETLHYIAPEQRSGGGIDLSSDVYAVGVLGYRVLTGRYPFGDTPPMLDASVDLKLVPAPSTLSSSLPPWVDGILARCLEPRQSDRFQNLAEVLNATERAIQTGQVDGDTGRWSKKTVMVSSQVPAMPPNAGQGRKKPSRPDVVPPFRTGEKKSGSTKGLLVVAVCLVVGIVISGLGFVVYDHFRNRRPTIDKEFQVDPQDAPPELRAPLTDFFSGSLPVNQRVAALETIAKSDDPFIYPVLDYAVRRSTEPEIKQNAQKFIVERVRRQGFPQTANLLTKWFQAFDLARQNAANAPVYTALLKACNPNLPIEIRKSEIQKAYAKDPTVTLQLVAALALDEPAQPGNFTNVLRTFLSVRLGRNDLQGRGAGALIIADRTLSVFFDQDIMAMLGKFSDPDLMFILRELAQGENALLANVAAEVTKRGSIPPFEGIFLKMLAENERGIDLPASVRQALVRGIKNELIEEDVTALGRWSSLDVEPTLLAVCAIAKDEEVRLAAFDTLAARTLNTEPGASLVAWVKSHVWEKRARVVKAIGIIGHASLAGSDQLEYAFDLLVPFAAGGSFLRTMVKTNEPRLIRMTLDRVAGISASDELVLLLNNPDKDIRIAAVKALEGRNDLATLQQVVKAYEKEKDEEVIKVYKEVHWVVRERG